MLHVQKVGEEFFFFKNVGVNMYLCDGIYIYIKKKRFQSGMGSFFIETFGITFILSTYIKAKIYIYNNYAFIS